MGERSVIESTDSTVDPGGVTTQQHTTSGGSRPSGSTAERPMGCNRCGGEWKTPVPRPSSAVACPFCAVHVCGCGCGQDMSFNRADAIYTNEAHGKRLKRAEDAASPDVTQTRTVDEAQAIQDAVRRDGPSLKQPTDSERVLIALQARGTEGIHSHELRRLGITGNPSQRIADLEEAGHQIQHEREHKGRRPGVRYRLAGAGAEEENQGEGTAGPALHGHRNAPAPSTGPSVSMHAIPSGAPSSSGAGSGEALPGLEPTAYDHLRDAA